MFKKKVEEEEPKIEFFTDLPHLVELAPPVPMRKAIPQWFKNTPFHTQPPKQEGYNPPGRPGPVPPPPPPAPPMKSNITMDPSTIKSCPGVMDILRWGYMVPLWADYEMITHPDTHQTGNYTLRASTAEVKASGFLEFHQGEMPQRDDEYRFTPKFDSPWVIRTPPGYSVALLPLPYGDKEFEQPWRIIPGIIDTDRYHSFNILVKWTYEGRYVIEQGTPMCVVVPFKRETTEIPLSVSQVTPQELDWFQGRGQGGTGNGRRFVTLPYQKWRKTQETCPYKMD